MKKILWDIDGTLLNFDLAETRAIFECFDIYSLDKPSDEMIKTYKLINKSYWERLERGEVTREQVLVGRFEDFFVDYGIDRSIASDFNKTYQEELGKTYVFNPYGKEIIEKLHGKYD